MFCLSQDQPSLSGLHDHDYPSLPEVGVGLESLSELMLEKRVPLPPELVEQFGRILLLLNVGAI